MSVCKQLLSFGKQKNIHLLKQTLNYHCTNMLKLKKTYNASVLKYKDDEKMANCTTLVWLEIVSPYNLTHVYDFPAIFFTKLIYRLLEIFWGASSWI